MKKEYINMNVFDELQKRFAFLFQEFKNIYISFSGGKDSGVLLNLLLDYRNKYASDRVIGVFHQDFEAQYTVTTDYITRTFKRLENESGIDLYWVCLPMATRTALSNYEMYWYPWDDTKQDIWVRPIPEYPYVINLTKPFTHYRYRMHQEDLAKQFGRFYKEEHGNGGTADLSIRNTDIKTSAGFPGSLKTYGVLHLYTTGQILTYGARIIASIMITTIYMICIIRQD